MLDLTAVDLRDDPAAIVAAKRPIPVPVRFAEQAGTVDTLEGPVAHDAGAAICRGVLGESWPVQRQRFDRDYGPLPGTTPGADGFYLKKPVEILVKRISTGRFFVRVGTRQDPIVGEVGDWLVQYSPEKRSIISDAVFQASYERVTGASDSSA